MISQEGGAEVLDRVHLSGIHDGFPVGGCHAQVEGCDHSVAVAVFSGDVDAGFEIEMIDRKACDFFHRVLHNRLKLMPLWHPGRFFVKESFWKTENICSRRRGVFITIVR